jgi:hypothetical protein
MNGHQSALRQVQERVIAARDAAGLYMSQAGFDGDF